MANDEGKERKKRKKREKGDGGLEFLRRVGEGKSKSASHIHLES